MIRKAGVKAMISTRVTSDCVILGKCRDVYADKTSSSARSCTTIRVVHEGAMTVHPHPQTGKAHRTMKVLRLRANRFLFIMGYCVTTKERTARAAQVLFIRGERGLEHLDGRLQKVRRYSLVSVWIFGVISPAAQRLERARQRCRIMAKSSLQRMGVQGA